MIKKPIFTDPESEIRAYKRSRMTKFLLGPKDAEAVRGAVLDATMIVRQMRANHDLGILETLILGHAYMGVLLMTSQLKGQDTVSLSIDCDGPVEGLSVEANAFGEVRGYLKNPSIPIARPVEPNDYREYFGDGIMKITRTLEGGKRPFTSTTKLEYGSIAQDLSSYYTVSEQTPSGFHLSIRFSPDGGVAGAGGLKLQALPRTESDSAALDLVRRIENQMMVLPSLGTEIADGWKVTDYVAEWFQGFDPAFLESRPIEFMCHCSETRFLNHLANLPASDREDLRENGPFPLVLTCHHCGSRYEISKDTILAALT